MGLAAPKERTKISKDPRNTFWSNDTSRFGHKYLVNLGWTPGQTLGDTSSSYHASGHITDASSNGIKIMLKDDTLGIGAKKGAQHDECTGLLGLQGLLGRLNGDEKQVEMVKKEEDRRKTEWISSKFGMRFVRGEVWKADDISKLREQMVQDKKAKKMEVMIKREDESDEETSEVTEEKDERKKEKKRKRSSTEDESNKKRKKSKAKAKPKRAKREEFEDEMKTRPKGKKPKRSKSTPTITSTTASGGETEPEPKRPKKDKEGGKSKEKRSRKDTKSKEKARKVASLDLENSSGSGREVSGSTTTGTSTLVSVTTGRNAVRARFIAAKRSAMMDAKSLNEILMIKA